MFKEQPNFLYFHYDRSAHLIAESLYGGFEWHEYVWLDDLPLAFITGGTIDTIHTDHLGAPQKMTDGGQNIVWDGAASDPFLLGQLPGSPPMNLRLPGQYFDSESGLHHNGMRDYDPTLGRYIESDPIGLDGGINTYAYVGDNPLRWTDSLGLAPVVPSVPVPGGSGNGPIQQCRVIPICLLTGIAVVRVPGSFPVTVCHYEGAGGVTTSTQFLGTGTCKAFVAC